MKHHPLAFDAAVSARDNLARVRRLLAQGLRREAVMVARISNEEARMPAPPRAPIFIAKEDRFVAD